MSGPAQAPETPITDKRQLIEYLERGVKPKPDWRIGTEHEKHAYNRDTFRPLPYENGRQSIRALLEGLRRKDGGTISEMLTHKIRNSGISQEIAQRAVAEWSNAEPDLIARECRGTLHVAIKRAAMAK